MPCKTPGDGPTPAWTDQPRSPPQIPQLPEAPSLVGPVHLSGIAQGGEAVGRHEALVIFVRGGVPGDVVLVRLEEIRKSYIRGVAEEVLSAAEDRVQPRCPLFGQCGGCHWQHIAYAAQLALKRTILEEQCRHLGGISDPPVRPTIGMENPWAYRTTTALHLTPDGLPGYFAWHSHDVVPVPACPLLAPALDDLLAPLRDALQEIPSSRRPARVTLRYSRAERRALVLLHGGSRQAAGTLQARLADRAAEMVWEHHGRPVILAGRGFLLESLGNRLLRVSATSFFQVNIPQAEKLFQVVASLLEPRATDHLLDGYAGVGALSLPLMGRVRTITAVESHPAAVADLKENARSRGRGPSPEAALPCTDVRVIPGRVEQVLPSLVGELAEPSAPFDLVLVDPPRRGCSPAVLRAICAGQARRIVYVSCHPGTLARDLRLLERGGYRVVEVQPVDLFPQTFHVESVTLLEQASGRPLHLPRQRPRGARQSQGPAC